MFRTVPKHSCALSEPEDIAPVNLKDLKGCRKFYWRLRILTLISEKNPRCRQYFRSQSAIMREMQRHCSSNNLHIIHPFSQFRMYWDFWMTFVLFATLLCSPLEIVTNINTDFDAINMTLLNIITVLDFLCIADIVVTFYSGYETSDSTKVVLNGRTIAKNYLQFRFIFDFMASFPFTYGIYLYQSAMEDAQKGLYGVPLLKIFKFDPFLTYLNRTMDILEISFVVSLIMRVASLTVLGLHWFSCIIYATPIFTSFFTGSLPQNSWILRYNLTDQPTRFKYVQSLMMATACLLNTNYGHFKPLTADELILHTIALLIGKLFVIFSFVRIVQMLAASVRTRSKYEEVMNEVQQYLRHKQLPLMMQQRLLSYYMYRYQNSYFREHMIELSLSEKLKEEINVYSCRRLIDSVLIFKNLPRQIILAIVNSLIAEFFLPNDTIIKAGTSGDCMYFIAHGTVAVFTPTGKEVCHLEDGAYFGEISLILKDQKRTASVVAIEICEIYKLSRAHFMKCFDVTSSLFKRLEEIANVRKEQTYQMEETYKRYLVHVEDDK